MNEKMRIDWLDTARGICIFLVVMGHSIIYTDVSLGGTRGATLEAWKNLCTWIYSFHMPLFFFVSGYLHSIKKSENNRKQYILGRSFSIITLYVTFSIIFWLAKFYFSKNVNNVVTIRDLVCIPIYPLSDMWFLYALVAMFLIREVVIHFQIDNKLYLFFCLVLSIAGSCVIWDEALKQTVLPRLAKNMIYYALGNVVVGKINFKELSRNRKLSFGLSIIFFLMGIGCICFVNIENEHLPIVVKGALNIIISIVNLTAVVIICQLEALKDIKTIDLLGRESLIVYLIHDYGVTGSVICLKQFVSDSSMCIILSTMVGLFVSIVAIWASHRINIVHILFHPEKLAKCL